MPGVLQVEARCVADQADRVSPTAPVVRNKTCKKGDLEMVSRPRNMRHLF